MDKLGPRLRQAREAKGSTLEDAEAATHIRAHFLELLEAGDFAAFAGGDVQVRGFLRIYARYLDLSPEDVLGQYSVEVHGATLPADESANNGAQPEPSDLDDDLTAIRFRPRDIPVTSSLPRWMSVRTVMIVGLVLILLLGILAVVTYVMNQPEDERPLIPLTTTAPMGITQELPEASGAGQPTSASPVSTRGGVKLVLEATEHTRVRVRKSGEVVFEQMMVPGQTSTWTDAEIIVVETGNGASLRVTVNGIALGTMCERGELCARA